MIYSILSWIIGISNLYLVVLMSLLVCSDHLGCPTCLNRIIGRRCTQDDWDSDFDDESVSQVGGPGVPAAGHNNYAQQQVSCSVNTNNTSCRA